MAGSVSFGAWLRQRRKAYDLTQEQLAERTHCAPETIRAIEAGRRRPSRELATLLATTLEVPSEELSTFVEFARVGVAQAATAGESQVLIGRYRRVSHLNNLPAPRTSFVGREREVDQVCALLLQEDVRQTTLLGPPGIGKTRLSLQVATRLRSHFADGVFFVALSPLTDAGMVAAAIARVLDVKEGSTRSLTAALQEYLQDKQLLLLLDNFEQVAAASTLIGILIERCAALKVLVTSRTALNLYGEHQFPVPPLSLPGPDDSLVAPEALTQYEAIDLFMQRARAIKPLFALTSTTAPIVVEICRQLDGLALAIELAAARSKVLSLAEILTRLSSRLKLLTSGATDLPPRQRTLRGAISWSYDLLDPAEQRLFRRMAVFVRGATQEAICAVCCLSAEPELDVLAVIASLLDKSLLEYEITANGESRYWMLWTIREYGLERLAECGEAAAVRTQHAAYYLELVEAAEPYFRSSHRDPWLDRLERELNNLRAALAWCLETPECVEWALRISGGLHWFWYFRGYLTEGRDWLEKALVLSESWRRTTHGAQALQAAGRLALLHDDYAAMFPRLQESVVIGREIGDQQGLAYSLTFLGLATVYRNRAGNSGGHLLVEEAVSLFHDLNDKWGLAFALNFLGDVTGLQGGPESQITSHKEQSLALYRELDDKWGIAYQLTELGHSALRQGDYDTARARLEEALSTDPGVDDKWSRAHAIRSLGVVAWHQREYTRAAELYNKSLILYRELGEKLHASVALRYLGHVAHDQGDYTKAEELYREALTLVYQLGNEQTVALCLAALAGVAAAQGRPQRAARLFGAAQTLREASHGMVPPPDRIEYQRNMDVLQALLDAQALARAWDEGNSLTIAQAVAYANDHIIDLYPQVNQVSQSVKTGSDIGY